MECGLRSEICVQLAISADLPKQGPGCLYLIVLVGSVFDLVAGFIEPQSKVLPTTVASLLPRIVCLSGRSVYYSSRVCNRFLNRNRNRGSEPP